MNDSDVIEHVLEGLTQAGLALEDEKIDLSDAWLRVAAQWLYLYEHVGLVDRDDVTQGEEDEDEEDEDEDEDLDELEGFEDELDELLISPHLNGSEPQVEEGVLEDDDPDDIARLGP